MNNLFVSKTIRLGYSPAAAKAIFDNYKERVKNEEIYRKKLEIYNYCLEVKNKIFSR